MAGRDWLGVKAPEDLNGLTSRLKLCPPELSRAYFVENL